MQIVALCGSLRAASYNRRLLLALAERCPEGVTVLVHDLRGIPVYDGDLEEAHGLPPAVKALQDAIAAADGWLLASPEYNGGVPGPLKNAVDWCSRGDGIRRCFQGKPTGLVGATPGTSGTRFAQQAWLQTFRQLGVRTYPGMLYVDAANRVFEGDHLEETTALRCARFMVGFAEFVGQR